MLKVAYLMCNNEDGFINTVFGRNLLNINKDLQSWPISKMLEKQLVMMNYRIRLKGLIWLITLFGKTTSKHKSISED